MTADLKERIARALCINDQGTAEAYDALKRMGKVARWMIEAQVTLSAIEAAGYVAVPREPTAAMELAAQGADGDWEHASGPDHWNAMIEAATKG